MSDFWYDHDQQRTVSSAEALDRFAKHIADEVAAAIRAELEPVARCTACGKPVRDHGGEDFAICPVDRVADIERRIEELNAQLVALSESHAHAWEDV